MKRILTVTLFIVAILSMVGVVWALPTAATIDGDPSDWDDATCLADQGGVDDETSPTRADITEFCAYVDSSYLYVAMAWDHTAFGGGTASTAGTRMDVDGDGLFDFIVLGTLENDPAVIQKYSVGSCDAGGACTNADDVCSSLGDGGGPCTGGLAASSGLWDDPFDPSPGHGGGNVCGGANCTTADAFIEIALPWSILGLSGPPSPHVFGDYGSYPSGPAQAPKDVVANGTGIVCQPDGTCYVTPPTAISLSSMGAATAQALSPVAFAGIVLLALLTLALARRKSLPQTAPVLRRRAGSAVGSEELRGWIGDRAERR